MLRGLIIEGIAISVLLGVAALIPRHTAKWLGTIERRIGQLASRRGLSVALVGMFAAGSSATLSLLAHVPYPQIMDEYSYLLAADTFASGRLSNPPHPFWVHFESLQLIQQPTYASKYPPAQGLILALGQVIGGHPIVGVWLSLGLAYAATYWMLLAWLPARWALLGAVVATWHPGILIWWGWSYWGGAVAMTGGALLFGAMRRIVRQSQVRDAVLLGVGLAILANSRPFEGFLAALPVAVVLFGWMMGNGRPSIQTSLGVALPIIVILIVTGMGMAFYNFKVTGNPLQIPYLVHERAYAVAPVLVWQSLRPEPSYRHKVKRDYHLGWELEGYSRQQSISGLVHTIRQKVKTLWTFYQGDRNLRIVLAVPLIIIPWVLRDRWMYFPFVTCGVLMVGLLMESWVFPHYAAPITSLALLVVLQAFRHVRVWRWRGERLGLLLVWAFTVVALSSFMVASVQKLPRVEQRGGSHRAQLIKQLEKDGGRHLVIVRHGVLHSMHRNWVWWYHWVYNEANIDAARVVWAHEMEATQNEKLLEYFQDRQVWLLHIDQDNIPPKLVPYSIELRNSGEPQHVH